MENCDDCGTEKLPAPFVFKMILAQAVVESGAEDLPLEEQEAFMRGIVVGCCVAGPLACQMSEDEFRECMDFAFPEHESEDLP